MDHSRFPLYPELMKKVALMKEEVKIEELHSNLQTIQNTPLAVYIYGLLLHHYMAIQPATFNKSKLMDEIPWSDSHTHPSAAIEEFTISLKDPTVRKLLLAFLKEIST